jgi:hypothetical protein
MDKEEIIKNINGTFYGLLFLIALVGIILGTKLENIETHLKNIETHQQQKK